jgi:transposase
MTGSRREPVDTAVSALTTRPWKYPEELRERAVKMVVEIRARDGKGRGEIARVGRQLGVHPEALRTWVRQAEIDGGTRPGTSTEDSRRIAELEREVRELRRANVISSRRPGVCDVADEGYLSGMRCVVDKLSQAMSTTQPEWCHPRELR